MDAQQLTSLFDHQAPTYDQQWARLAPFRDGLHLLIGSLFASLPADARILCVGAGTGAEILCLGALHPGWSFTAVEPSAGMLDVCRQRIAEHGMSSRCTFHGGFLDTLPGTAPFHAATCLLVSQFILDPVARSGLFRGTAGRLGDGGHLVSSDLSFDIESADYPPMLDAWMRVLSTAVVTPEGVARLREAYARDVAVSPPQAVEAMIEAGGFDRPVQFFQAGLIRAWHARRFGPVAARDDGWPAGARPRGATP
jgi:tRNA (cmo5U34)-methyltransferase